MSLARNLSKLAALLNSGGQVTVAGLSAGAPAWDTSGNLALNGATPNAWGGVSSGRVFQTGGAAFYGRTDTPDAYVATNLYRDSSNVWRYQTTAAAAFTQLSGNNFYLYSADSGTAGNSISFTQTLQVGKGASLALQGASSVAGTGITFPATQSASSDANTLDDYEEGTWTPTLERYSTQPSVSYITRAGTYVKIGKTVIVHCSIYVGTVSGNGSGINQLKGLPFAPNTTLNYAYNGVVHYNSIFSTANARSVMAYLNGFVFHDSGANTSEINDNYVSNGYLSFTATYITDA